MILRIMLQCTSVKSVRFFPSPRQPGGGGGDDDDGDQVQIKQQHGGACRVFPFIFLWSRWASNALRALQPERSLHRTASRGASIGAKQCVVCWCIGLGWFSCSSSSSSSSRVIVAGAGRCRQAGPSAQGTAGCLPVMEQLLLTCNRLAGRLRGKPAAGPCFHRFRFRYVDRPVSRCLLICKEGRGGGGCSSLFFVLLLINISLIVA